MNTISYHLLFICLHSSLDCELFKSRNHGFHINPSFKPGFKASRCSITNGWMHKYQNTVVPTPAYILSTEAESPTYCPLLPNLLNFPAESQVERSRRGLALIFRDKESQVLEKCLILVFKPFSPYSRKTPTSASLPGPSQATPTLPGSPPVGGPPFPHSLWNGCLLPGTRRKPATSEARQAGALPTAVTHGSSTPTSSAGSGPTASKARATFKPEPPRLRPVRLEGPHTAGQGPPHPQASHRHHCTHCATHKAPWQRRRGRAAAASTLDRNHATKYTAHWTLSLPESAQARLCPMWRSEQPRGWSLQQKHCLEAP